MTEHPTITVRHAEPTDAESLNELYQQPQAIWGTLQLPYTSLQFTQERLAQKRDGRYSLVAEIDDRVVGQLGLQSYTRPRRQHVGGLGMAVHDDWQGQGVGTALMAAAVDLADNWLQLTRLELTVFTDNEPALRLYHKFDFVIEGTHIRYAFRDGAYVDTHFMARIRPGIIEHG